MKHRIIINAPTHGQHAPARLNINGKRSEFACNEEITVTDQELENLRNSDNDIQYICEIDDAAVEEAPAPGDSGGAGDAGAGGGSGDASGETSGDTQTDETPTEPQGATDVQPTTDPLDHDQDGQKGGSLAGEESTAAKGAKKRRARKA